MSCDIKHLEYLQDVTEYWFVDPVTGEPDVLGDTSTDGDFLFYRCWDCMAEFSDWREAKMHYEASGVATTAVIHNVGHA